MQIPIFLFISYATWTIFQWRRKQPPKNVAIAEIAAVVLAVLFASLVTIFARSGPIRFSTSGELTPSFAFIYAAMLAGMLSQYLFENQSTFDLISFVKPILVSPIVFLPIWGVLQPLPGLEEAQLTSFCLIAFQNGFFWKTAFDRLARQSGEPPPKEATAD